MSQGEKGGPKVVGRAHGSPTKDFFVRMITRDISLADCILDLLDNSIDGARRSIKRTGAQPSSQPLTGYSATLAIDESKLQVVDNCGGIALNDAIDYAFHFGRRKDAPKDVDYSIGLYGIGMKRAIFKIGRKARIESKAPGEAFSVDVDVDTWEADDSDWDFDLGHMDPSKELGTRILIESLYPQIAAAFADKSFANELIRTIARDYAFIIGKGFSVTVGAVTVPHFDYSLKEGEGVESAIVEYAEDGVRVRIVAGLMNDLSDEVPEELRPDETDPYGWYVVCNDRVVLAGDKSEMTIWGHQNYRVWHNQYNGFAGFVFFDSEDPKKLPWTTTKREVDVGDPLYLRAVGRMKELTDVFVAYTNQRKVDLPAAKKLESATTFVQVSSVPGNARPMRLPRVAGAASGVDQTTISYRKPRIEIKEVAEALGDASMPAREVGKRTFEYFRREEMGKS